MENKESKCPHCGSSEYFIGKQTGYATMKISYWSVIGEEVQHEICASCGTIIRSYIENPQKWSGSL